MTHKVATLGIIAFLAIASTANARVVVFPGSGRLSSDDFPYKLECVQREGTNILECRRFTERRQKEQAKESPSGWRCFDTYKVDHTKRPLLFCKSSITGGSKTVYKDFLP